MLQSHFHTRAIATRNVQWLIINNQSTVHVVIQTLPKLVRLIVNCCVYTCVIEVLVSAGYVRVAEICGNLCFWTLTVEAGVVVCKAIAAVWYRFRRSRALASLHQPSQQQLTQLNDEGEKCAICLGEMLDAGVECVLLTQCGHAFHRICLIWWLNDHFTCPMCRQRIIGRPMCIGDLAEMLLPDDYWDNNVHAEHCLCHLASNLASLFGFCSSQKPQSDAVSRQRVDVPAGHRNWTTSRNVLLCAACSSVHTCFQRQVLISVVFSTCRKWGWNGRTEYL